MKKLALLLALLLASPALAVTYHDTDGSVVPAYVPLGACANGSCTAPTSPTGAPYTLTPLSPGQHNVAITSATALTIPTGALFAEICASTAAAKYTTDGTTTPTATIGMPLNVSTCVWMQGATVLANFKAISATGTLDVEYFK